MRKYSLLFFIRQSFSGLFMNGVMTATSIFILMSCLILMGCFGLLIFNMNLNLEKIGDLNKIVIFIEQEYEAEEEIERIKSQVANLDNISQWQFITKDEAFKRWMSLEENLPIVEMIMEDAEFEEDVKRDKTLRNSIEIEYKNIDKVGTLVYQLKNIEGVDANRVRNQAELAEMIQNLKNVVMLVMIWFLLILFVIAIAIILNTIKLSVNSRKNEIMIMRYIGATNFFILFPFLIEGAIIGITSAVIAYFIQWYIYGIATDGVLRMEAGLSVVPFSELNILLFLIFLFTGVFTGLFGSALSSNKYLKV